MAGSTRSSLNLTAGQQLKSELKSKKISAEVQGCSVPGFGEVLVNERFVASAVSTQVNNIGILLLCIF